MVQAFLRALKTLSAPTFAPDAADLALLGDAERNIYQRTYNRVLDETGDAVKAGLAAAGALRRYRSGFAVKAREDDSGAVVAGWGLLFADSPQQYDTDHTWFAREGEFLLDYYHGAPLWMEHGQSSVYGIRPIGQRVEVQLHEHGIWAVHRLHADHPLYAKTLEMVNSGQLSYSSDSILHYVDRGFTDDRELSVWPLAGWSLVRRPAEPGLGTVIEDTARARDAQGMSPQQSLDAVSHMEN